MSQAAQQDFLRLNLRWAMNLVRLRLAALSISGDADDVAGLAAEQAAVVAALEALAARREVPFFELAARLHLSGLEAQVLGLCLAQMLDPEMGRLLAELPGSAGPQVTPAAVAQLLCEDDLDARLQLLQLVSPSCRLRALRLLETPRPQWDGLLDTPLHLSRACLSYLSGLPLLSPCCRFVPPGEAAPRRRTLGEGQERQIYDLVTRFAAVLVKGAAQAQEAAGIGWILLLFWGPAGMGKGALAREIGASLFGGTVVLDAAAAQATGVPLAVLHEALDLAVLRGALLLIENGEALAQGGADHLLLAQLRVSPACVVVSATGRKLGEALEPAWSLVTRFLRPGLEDPVQLWQGQLPAGVAPDVDALTLGRRYPLSAEAVGRAVRMAQAYCAAEGIAQISMAQLERAAAAQVAGEQGPPRQGAQEAGSGPGEGQGEPLF